MGGAVGIGGRTDRARRAATTATGYQPLWPGFSGLPPRPNPSQ